MKLFARHKVSIIIFLLIAAAYFLLRIPNLTLQPIFADEAIYIRWAQVMRADPTLRFLPLTDGKTPLFMWLMIPMFKIIEDPLMVGRILSVFSGFGTLLGVSFLGLRFFSASSALWAGLFIAVTPYMVFFDRLALVDSMLAAFSIWSLNLALLLLRYKRLDLAMGLGYLFGGGLLTKTPAMLNILVLPTTLLAFDWKNKKRQAGLIKLFGLWIVALVIAFSIYNALRLGSGFGNLSSRNQDYIFSPLEIKDRPLDPFIPHFHDISEWFPILLTYPMLILIIGGVVYSVLKRNYYALSVIAWSVIPLLILMAFLRTFTARYLLISIPPLIFIAGYFLSEILARFKLKRVITTAGALVLILPLTLMFDIKLLSDPFNTPLPNVEKDGYFENWTAGYGLKDIAGYVMKLSQEKGMIVVGTQGSFGTLPDGLLIYLDKYNHSVAEDKRVIVLGGGSVVWEQLKQAAQEHPTFYLANKDARLEQQEGLLLIKKYLKVKSPNGSQNAIMLFEVKP